MMSLYIALGLMFASGVLVGIVLASKKVVDLNKDGEVNIDDAKIIADINKDGKVDQADLAIAKDAMKAAAKQVTAVLGEKKK